MLYFWNFVVYVPYCKIALVFGWIRFYFWGCVPFSSCVCYSYMYLVVTYKTGWVCLLLPPPTIYIYNGVKVSIFNIWNNVLQWHRKCSLHKVVINRLCRINSLSVLERFLQKPCPYVSQHTLEAFLSLNTIKQLTATITCLQYLSTMCKLLYMFIRTGIW